MQFERRVGADATILGEALQLGFAWEETTAISRHGEGAIGEG